MNDMSQIDVVLANNDRFTSAFRKFLPDLQ